jgi:hypothetical protein
MISELDDLKSNFERAEYLQSIIISRATGGEYNNDHYNLIRKEFLDNPTYKTIIPNFIKNNRNLEQFWQFIKNKYSTYAERRSYIWEQFRPLLDNVESSNSIPAEKTITSSLNQFDAEGVHYAWTKALERKVNDPDGAITIARTIIETVCKNILDKMDVDYNPNNIDLSELYKLVAKELNLTTDQHTEKIFKQILGGCSAIVNGLRNKLGDAHGQGMKKTKPGTRHAELAVNLSGTMSLFLIDTYKNKIDNEIQ